MIKSNLSLASSADLELPLATAPFPPGLIKLSSHLIRFENTCNVYAIFSGREAILVDFGDGSILEQLALLGIDRVTDIFMTHHHRDQGQGLALAVLAGTRIWVPHMEQDLFQDVDAAWQASDLSNRYDVRQTRFSLLDSVPVTGTLQDYGSLHLDLPDLSLELTVIPTPGHTPGSISLLGELDGLKLAFTGDLIAAPGKVWSMAATQWSYSGAEGVAYSIPSLLDIKQRSPEMLLPSHGAPIYDPGPAIELLINRFGQLLQHRRQNPRMFELIKQPYETISPHLLRNRTSLAYSYVLLSESGKALFIDYGYDFMTGMSPGSDRASKRPWLYTLETLKRTYGVQKVDVVIPTHYHDDHTAGFNLLRAVEGTQVWAADNFADLLISPSHYDLPCLWFDPISVDRRLPLEQEIDWEEYQLFLYSLSGHTRYSVAIFFEVDGKRVLACGDQYKGEGNGLWNYIYQNRFEASGYRASAELYNLLKPDLILPGHAEPVWVQPEYLHALREQGEALERLHSELLPEQVSGFQMEGFGARILPYHSAPAHGEIIEYSVEIHNPLASREECAVRMIAPPAWEVIEVEHRIWLEACSSEVVQFHVKPQYDRKVRRARLAVDMTLGGQHYGQQAEALVTIQ